MKLSVIGISHATAPVEVRERFALPQDLARQFLRAVRDEDVFEEAMVLNTCNRTEVYFVAGGEGDFLGYLLGHIARLKGLDPVSDTSAFYHHRGVAAVEHIFRVAAALESQIVGEHQILGQVKNAYRLALEERTAGFLLSKLLHWTFRVGKKVQTETELGRGAVSVARAAVDLACQVFSRLDGKAVLLVGAGQTAELAARVLISRRVGSVIVANRTLERAEEVIARLVQPGPALPEPDGDSCEPAQCPAVSRVDSDESAAGSQKNPPPQPATRAIRLSEIADVIADVDLAICSTGSPEPVLTADALGSILRRTRHPLFIVDIAVPRDVDPQLDRLPNVFLYNMDDLDAIIDQNIERRCQEIPRAQAISRDELQQFVKWFDSLHVTPTIKLLQRRFGLLQEAEIKRYGRKFSSGDGGQLRRFTQCLCNKIIHHPISFLREPSPGATTSDQLAAVDMIRRMFDLDDLDDLERSE